MVAAELTVGMAGDPLQEQLALDFVRPLSLLEEGLSQTAGPPQKRSTDDVVWPTGTSIYPAREKPVSPPFRLMGVA